MDVDDDEPRVNSEGPAVPEDAQKLPDGIPLNQISALNFNDQKQDMILRLMDTGHPEDRALAVQAAEAQTLDDLYRISMSKKTVAANEGNVLRRPGAAAQDARSDYQRSVQEQLKNAKSADYQEMINRERKKALEKYGVRNAKTGLLEMPSVITPEQVAKIAEERPVLVHKAPDAELERKLSMLAAFAPNPANYAAIEDGGEDAQREADARMEQDIEQHTQQVAEVRRVHFNSIMEMSSAESPQIGCDLSKVEWLQHSKSWRDYFPLTDSLIKAALTKRAGIMQLSLTWLPCYPSVVYTPKLLFFLKKEVAGHAIPFLSVYQFYDAVFSHLCTTNLRQSHARFLREQEQAVEKLQAAANQSKNAKEIEFVVLHRRGIERAKAAYAENPPRILSPYVEMLQHAKNPLTGEPFTLNMVPQHSADELKLFVDCQKQIGLQIFDAELKKAEHAVRKNQMSAADFLQSYYFTNHAFCVHLLNTYEYAIMCMYEDLIPWMVRADLKTPPDTVRGDQVDKHTLQLLNFELDSYAKVRAAAHEHSQHQKGHKITYSGVELDLSTTNVHGRVDEQLGEASPTNLQLYEFYRSLNIQYGKGEQFAATAEYSNELYKSMRSEGMEGGLDRFLQTQALQSIAGSQSAKRKKKR